MPGCRIQTIFDFRMGITGQGLIPYKDPLNFVHDSKFEDDLIAALTWRECYCMQSKVHSYSLIYGDY